MIRNKDYGIEEVKFDRSLLKHAELLDETLRRIRSFRVNFESEDDVDRLLGSLERTKAGFLDEDANLSEQKVSVRLSTHAEIRVVISLLLTTTNILRLLVSEQTTKQRVLDNVAKDGDNCPLTESSFL